MPNLLFPGVASRLRLWAEDRPRRWKKLFFICFDALLLVAIVWLSFSLRLGEVFRPNLEQALLMLDETHEQHLAQLGVELHYIS